MVIDGHLITMSFSSKPNNDLFGRIKNILLSSDSASQNCLTPDDGDTMQKSEQEGA